MAGVHLAVVMTAAASQREATVKATKPTFIAVRDVRKSWIGLIQAIEAIIKSATHRLDPIKEVGEEEAMARIVDVAVVETHRPEPEDIVDHALKDPFLALLFV